MLELRALMGDVQHSKSSSEFFQVLSWRDLFQVLLRTVWEPSPEVSLGSQRRAVRQRQVRCLSSGGSCLLSKLHDPRRLFL